MAHQTFEGEAVGLNPDASHLIVGAHLTDLSLIPI